MWTDRAWSKLIAFSNLCFNVTQKSYLKIQDLWSAKLRCQSHIWNAESFLVELIYGEFLHLQHLQPSTFKHLIHPEHIFWEPLGHQFTKHNATQHAQMNLVSFELPLEEIDQYSVSVSWTSKSRNFFTNTTHVMDNCFLFQNSKRINRKDSLLYSFSREDAQIPCCQQYDRLFKRQANWAPFCSTVSKMLDNCNQLSFCYAQIVCSLILTIPLFTLNWINVIDGFKVFWLCTSTQGGYFYWWITLQSVCLLC